jgi:hypothetical protein
MSTLGGNVLTLADWAKRLDGEGKVPEIVEMLSQTNPVLQEMQFKEGNLPTGERTTIRTGLPTVYWRLINQGVPPSKSTTAQVDEQAGMLEAWSEVDKDLAQLNGNVGAFRLSEAQAFIEGMSQEAAQTLFYGNSSTAPEEFNGLAVRYSSLSAANAQNIVSAGGSGSDNTSIWLIVWGANTVHGIFPKGSKAGLVHDDLGLVTVETTAGIAGNRMRAYQDHFQWKIGVAVKDWRYAARVCNIDVSVLAAGDAASITAREALSDYMIQLMHRIPNLNAGRAAFYMNRTAFQYLDIGRKSASAPIDVQSVEGKLLHSFRGVPIRVTDAILDTEATVS